jgi:ribose transport system substrate-binding protein
MKKSIIILITLFALTLTGCSKNATSGKKFTIAVVPKGTTHPFWKSVNAGAQKAANDYKAQGVEVDLIWKRTRS